MTQTDVIRLDVTPAQAKAIEMALDLFVRVGLGQLEKIEDLLRNEIVPAIGTCDAVIAPATADECDAVRALLLAAKRTLGFPENGSRGIGHPHNHIAVTRAYEVGKVLSKTLAEHNNPTPKVRGVQYDGLVVRYTKDPEPKAVALVRAPHAERRPSSGPGR